MGRKRTPGLFKRGQTWHIDKQVKGQGRLCESTGESVLEKAEQYLVKRLEEIRAATVYGIRPRRTFRQASTKYLLENQHKRSIGTDAGYLRSLDPFIGDLALPQVHDDTLAKFVNARKAKGTRTKTLNNAMGVVRRILNLAARSWRDEHGLTWLETPPLITMLAVTDACASYPLSWDEQRKLFGLLPVHLARMALFKVNTGCREQEVCQLRWAWMQEVPEIGRPVFVIPDQHVKNKEDRVVVLNDVALSVINDCRGQHPVYVFTYKGQPVTRIHNTAWKRSWREAGLPTEGVKKGPHNLKHTYGRRLRAAGVSLETRKVLLGHTSGDITTHYSAPELQELLDASQRVCADKTRKTPALTLLRRTSGLI